MSAPTLLVLRHAADAEKQALWNLSCLLERELVEPFQADYVDKVNAAKRSPAAEE